MRVDRAKRHGILLYNPTNNVLVVYFNFREWPAGIHASSDPDDNTENNMHVPNFRIGPAKR